MRTLIEHYNSCNANRRLGVCPYIITQQLWWPLVLVEVIKLKHALEVEVVDGSSERFMYDGAGIDANLYIRT